MPSPSLAPVNRNSIVSKVIRRAMLSSQRPGTPSRNAHHSTLSIPSTTQTVPHDTQPNLSPHQPPLLVPNSLPHQHENPAPSPFFSTPPVAQTHGAQGTAVGAFAGKKRPRLGNRLELVG